MQSAVRAGPSRIQPVVVVRLSRPVMQGPVTSAAKLVILDEGFAARTGDLRLALWLAVAHWI